MHQSFVEMLRGNESHVAEFRDRFDVSAAPAVVCVRDGEAVAAESGYRSPAAVADIVAGAFDDD